MRHKACVDSLFNKYFIRHNMKRIHRKLHKVGTYDVCKISLSCFADKRYILNDGIKSLAYFHKDVRIDQIKSSQLNQGKSIKSSKVNKINQKSCAYKAAFWTLFFLFSSIYIEGTKIKSFF